MSRSFKKNPFSAVACYSSNKKDKVTANRKFRKASRQKLKADLDLPYSLKEVSNTYEFSSDGLAYYHSRRDFDHLAEYGYDPDEEYRRIFRK